MENTSKKALYDLHFDHIEWLNKLAFYKDEIKILKHRLDEVAAKNNNKDVMAMVEHFENQFKIQNNNIDEIRHNVKQEENKVVNNIHVNPTASDHRKVSFSEDLVESVNSFEKNFNVLRHELNTFLSKWM
jgi:hypothetical protein